MIMQMTSTLQGIEYYYNIKMKSIFDDIRLPDGVDKQVLTNTILIEAGELECIYSNGDFLRVAIRTWFERKYNMIDKWIKLYSLDYNPLSNFQMNESLKESTHGTSSGNDNKSSTTSNTRGVDSTKTNDGTSSTDRSGNDITENNLTNLVTRDTTDSEVGSGSSTTGEQVSSSENKVSAFNDADYTPSSKNSTNNGSRNDSSNSTSTLTRKGTETTTDTGTVKVTLGTKYANTANNTETTKESITDSGTITDALTSNKTEDATRTHSKNITGNIGNITNQELVTEEYKLWGKVDIYKDIAEMFILDFCICVY